MTLQYKPPGDIADWDELLLCTKGVGSNDIVDNLQQNCLALHKKSSKRKNDRIGGIWCQYAVYDFVRRIGAQERDLEYNIDPSHPMPRCPQCTTKEKGKSCASSMSYDVDIFVRGEPNICIFCKFMSMRERGLKQVRGDALGMLNLNNGFLGRNPLLYLMFGRENPNQKLSLTNSQADRAQRRLLDRVKVISVFNDDKMWELAGEIKKVMGMPDNMSRNYSDVSPPESPDIRPLPLFAKLD